MKLRIGFVTNSSSSSFTIAKSDLTDDQIEKIKNYFEVAKEVGMNDFDDWWDINETNFKISGFTCMDNGDMNKFLRLIGINRDIVEWEDWS